MFNPIVFFQPDRLLEMRPYTTPQTLKIMLAFFVILAAIAVGLKIWKIIKKPAGYIKKIIDKYISLLAWMSAFGLIMVLAKYERASILSARFWLIAWAIVAIWWLCLIVRYQLKTVPEAKKQIEQKKQFMKYLPKKK